MSSARRTVLGVGSALLLLAVLSASAQTLRSSFRRCTRHCPRTRPICGSCPPTTSVQPAAWPLTNRSCAGWRRVPAGDYAGALPWSTRPSLASTALADYAHLLHRPGPAAPGAAGRRPAHVRARHREEAHRIRRDCRVDGGGSRGGCRRPGRAVGSTSASPIRRARSPTTCCTRLGRAALAAGDRKRAARGLPPRLLRVPADRRRHDGGRRSSRRCRTCHPQQLQGGSRPRADPVRRPALHRGARARSRRCRRQVDGDDKEARRSAHRGVRLLPEALRRRARRSAAVSRRGVAQGRSALLLSERLRELGDHDQSVALTRALVERVPRQLLGRGSAQQSRHLLHRHRRGRPGGADVQGALREVPDRAARRARGLEVRLVGLHDRQLRGDRRGCSRAPRPRSRAPTTGRRSCIGRRARTRSSATARQARRAPAAGLRRLRELVLRPARASASSPAAQAAARRARRGPASRSQPPGRRRPDAQPIPTDAAHPAAARQRAVRRRAGRAALRAAAWGSSPAIEATIAWVYHQKGELRRAHHR